MKINKYINKFGFFSILLIVFLVPIYFSYFVRGYDFYVLPKQGLFHLLVMFGVISFLVNVFVKKKFKCKTSIVLKKFLFILFCLCLSLLISVLFSDTPQSSFWGVFLREQGLYSYLYYIVFFLLIICVVKTASQIEYVLLVVPFSSFLIGIYGLFEYYGLFEGHFDGRIASTLGQPNYFGHYLIMTFPVLVYFWFFLKRGVAWKIFLLMVMILQFANLIFTYSRAAWLGFIVALGIFLVVLCFLKFFSLNKKNNVLTNNIKIKRRPLLIIFSIIFFVFIFFFNNDFFYNRLASFADFSSGSIKNRLIYWSASINELRDMDAKKVLFGYGPDAMGNVFAKHYKKENAIFEKINTYPSRAHNFIFDSLLQFGIVGSLMFFLFFYYVLEGAIFSIKKYSPNSKERWLIYALLIAIFAHFINNLFSFSLVVTSIYTYLYLALLCRLSYREIINCSFSNNCVRFLFFYRFIICLILIFLLCIVYNYDYKFLKADYFRFQAEKAFLVNDCDRFAKNIKKSIALNFYKLRYKQDFLEYGSRCLLKIEEETAKQILVNDLIDIITQIKLLSPDYRSTISVAHTYSYLGLQVNPVYFKLAELEYLAAINFNPELSLPYRNLAQVLAWQGKYREALKYLEVGLSNMPNVRDSRLELQVHKEHKEEVRQELDAFRGIKNYIMTRFSFFER